MYNKMATYEWKGLRTEEEHGHASNRVMTHVLISAVRRSFDRFPHERLMYLSWMEVSHPS